MPIHLTGHARILLLLCSAWMLARTPALAASAVAVQPGPLRAGVAKVDITPLAAMFPFNQRVQVLAGVHDPIYARALVLDNGITRLALLSVDTAGLPNGEAVQKAVAAELAIPTDQLSIAITHDHNTPTFGAGPRSSAPDANVSAYLALMQERIMQAVHEANSHLQPARIGFATGKAYINTNRDQKIGDSYKMGYAPEHASDKTVAVMVVTGAAGEPIAIWSNYAVHGVVMFLSKTRNGQSEITGDIGGATAAYVEERMKGTVQIWTSGAAGDQNPLFMSMYNQDAPDVHDEGEAGWALLDVQSRRLGEEIVRVAEGIQNTTDRVTLWGARAEVSCPGRVASLAPTDSTAPGSATPGAGGAPMVDGDPVNIPLHLMMINDIALANVTGEVFTDISQKYKQQSLFDRTAMVTLSGGSLGYIPSESAYLLPSAMAARNPIKPGCAEARIVESFLQLQRQYLDARRAGHP